MKPETMIRATLPARAEKYTTTAQILARINTLKNQHFIKGERGIGTRDAEIKQLERRLKTVQNPTLF